MAVTNIVKSILDRLRNQSKETGLQFQTVLQLFVQEEFLRKLSISNYCNKFILKGGMFIYTLTNFDSRPTRDVDFIVRNLDAELNSVLEAVQSICEISTGNDYIVMQPKKIEQIGFQKEYPGARVSLVAEIDKVKVPFSVDIGIDDVVIPAPSKRRISTRLKDFEEPEIYTYSLETTIAEKLDAILERMSLTSRMKDFYDIYYLSSRFDFDGKLLAKAVKETMSHRKRKIQDNAFDNIRAFAENDQLLNHWSNFEIANNSELSFETVINKMCEFLKPVYIFICKNEEFLLHWNCKNQKWE